GGDPCAGRTGDCTRRTVGSRRSRSARCSGGGGKSQPGNPPGSYQKGRTSPGAPPETECRDQLERPGPHAAGGPGADPVAGRVNLECGRAFRDQDPQARSAGATNGN